MCSDAQAFHIYFHKAEPVRTATSETIGCAARHKRRSRGGFIHLNIHRISIRTDPPWGKSNVEVAFISLSHFLLVGGFGFEKHLHAHRGKLSISQVSHPIRRVAV